MAANLHEIHIPDVFGRPICGSAGGRTSAFAAPTCPRCRARVTPAGIRPVDLLNPSHPVGRIAVGSALGLPGFPHIPGIGRRFGG